ncbi:LPS-assembly protein LptD [Sansalvadorimonas verongulae]|uniref:LPS-assembly protein LptD n=1 Tax=Sansalvadorimonas verongulae TaxID=2172824 RepID=UPI0012BB74F5|nr:LPS-assembly protein LptD [Sansalvadorimonas verongulae]MTI15469.1 LPS-assembly protein LptD [Sansalvadorimonas verongulae]
MMESPTEADGKAGFKPMAKNIFILRNKLPLVITTGLLASLPVLPAAANTELTQDTQWLCQQNTAGNGWQCNIAPRKAGPIPFAKRAPVTPALKKAPDIPVVVEGQTSRADSALAVTALTAPANAEVSALPVSPTAAGSEQSTSVASAFATLDWRPLNQLPAARQTTRSALMCEGGYVEPYRPGIDFKGDPSDAPIFAEADESTYLETGQGTLTGNVVVRQGYRQIESDVANMDRNTSESNFIGNVVIREPNILMVGDRADVNMDSGRAEVTNAKYVFHDAGSRGKAQSITRRESGIIDLDKATYTTCKPGSCVWKLDAGKVELNPTSGFGTATNATLDLWNLPVFYTPWISFPLDDRRKSGLLFPSFAWDSGTDGNGFDYTQPIYWNIAPNMDATITPRVMTNRGALVESEFRYLTPSAKGELGGAYTTADQVEDKNLNYDQNRWMVNLLHEQNLTSNWSYRVNYTDTSDREYFDDFGTALNVDSISPLKKEIYTTYEGGGQSSNQWKVSLGTQQLENMTQDADDPYNKDIDFDLTGAWDIGSGFGFDYAVGYTDFQRDKDWKYQKQQLVTTVPGEDVYRGLWGEPTSKNTTHAIGQRLNTDSTVKYRFQNIYSFVEPGVQLRTVNYDLDRVDANSIYVDQKPFKDFGYSDSDLQKPSTAGATYYLDSGLFFDRPASFGNMKFTQTLEPRAKYVYTPHIKDQDLNPNFDSSESSFSYSSLWRNDRFSGPDRIGDTNQLALGITSRFLEDNGYERFKFGIGQIFYFQDRKLFIDATLNDNNKNNDTNLTETNQRKVDANKASTSPLATQLVWNIRRDLRLTQDWMYNTNAGHNSEYAIGMQYLPKAGSVFNARYRYRDQVDRTVKESSGANKGNNKIVNGKPVYTSGNLEEVDFSAVWPLTPQWSVLGRYTHDLTNKRNMERSFGFEQESCCYMIRVMYRNWIDPTKDIDTAETDKGIFFEFVLKGLGNITSSRVGAFLNEITGYSSRKD